MAETLAELAARIRLVQTCQACPEQYDAFHGDELVGYLRLRGGCFRVDCPNVRGKAVYMVEFRTEPYKGMFATAAERADYLGEARLAIARWLLRGELAELDRQIDKLAEQRAHAFEHRQYIRDAELAGAQLNLRERRVALCKLLEEDPHG